MNMLIQGFDKLGQIMELVINATNKFSLTPHTRMIVRIGDNGPEYTIEQVRVRGGIQRQIILQTKATPNVS